MVIIIEVSRPIQLRPGIYRSRITTRVWWLYVAIAILHVPIREFSETAYKWER